MVPRVKYNSDVVGVIMLIVYPSINKLREVVIINIEVLVFTFIYYSVTFIYSSFAFI